LSLAQLELKWAARPLQKALNVFVWLLLRPGLWI